MFKKQRDDSLMAIALSESAAATRSANIEMGRFTETFDRAVKADIEARDRADIPLAEYNRMRSEINALKFENCRLKEFLEKIEFPLDVDIIPGSLQTRYDMSPIDRKVGIQICFEVDDYEFYQRVAKGIGTVNDFCI